MLFFESAKFYTKAPMAIELITNISKIMKKTFNTKIDGYWREANASRLPSHSGVYFVYKCIQNPDRTLSIRQLLYIGESENVNMRIANHEKLGDWRHCLKPKEELCFSTCPIDSSDRERIEAAYIFKHQPPCNTDSKCSFNYDCTTVNSTNMTHLLHQSFTIEKT